MIVFADNDFVLCLAGCELLSKYIHLQAPAAGQVIISAEASYSLPSQARRLLKGSAAAQDQLQSLLAQASRQTTALDTNILDTMSCIPNLDRGESLLLLDAATRDGCRLVTNDKRALSALTQHREQLLPVYEGILGKVHLVASALLTLIESEGFELVSRHVQEGIEKGGVKDSEVKMSFGPGRDQQHAVECLSSFSRGHLHFLANSELILPPQ